ncbi:hypothetical protein KC218_24250, partial [Mycobacterium tuberculosis]|nr:hypothetical protein [Mycobacterium tuberculosis]
CDNGQHPPTQHLRQQHPNAHSRNHHVGNEHQQRHDPPPDNPSIIFTTPARRRITMAPATHRLTTPFLQDIGTGPTPHHHDHNTNTPHR